MIEGSEDLGKMDHVINSTVFYGFPQPIKVELDMSNLGPIDYNYSNKTRFKSKICI